MLHWRQRVAEVFPAGGMQSFELAGARAEITVSPRLAAELTDLDVEEIAAHLLYLSFVWHELASWLGYQSFPGFPETNSSFSPDDLVSDLLGIDLGRRLLAAPTTDLERWNEMLDVELHRLLVDNGALFSDATREVFDGIEGDWWDAAAVLPAPELVRRRHLQFREAVEPWLVTGVSGCSAEAPRPMSTPELSPRVAGSLEIVITPDARLAAVVGTTVASSDLDGLVEMVRSQMVERLGRRAATPP